ncbi:MAG: hypothetical protein ABJA87_03995 [bacterium]
MPEPVAAARREAATRLFGISDPRIAEVSGIARGLRSADVYWVHNDSGHAASLFALDARTGAVRGVYSVSGVTNVDWEDVAVALDARGVASIWIADIGDNDATRSEVRIYRVDEPAVPESATTGRTSAADEWRLRYPDGPRDAEALAVAPGGAMWIFDKVVFGSTQAFRVPAIPDSRRARAVTPVGRFLTRDTGTRGGPGPIGRLTVTGAALNRTGTVLAIRTYTDAYVWPVRGGDIAAALRTSPVVAALPAQPQGEGISVVGARMVLDGEGAGAQVWSVPLPALSTESQAGAGGTTGRSTGSSRSSVSSEVPRPARTALLPLGAAGVVGLVLAGGLALARARRRSR